MFNKKDKKLQKIIEKRDLFDKVFYLKTYRDVRLADMTPLEHYVTIGIQEDRKPNATFDPVWYREYYQDVKEDGGYPLVHYILFGSKENRFQNEAEKNEYEKLQNDGFDVEFYKNNYEDLMKIADENFDFILHYIRFGKFEGRKYINEVELIKKRIIYVIRNDKTIQSSLLRHVNYNKKNELEFIDFLEFYGLFKKHKFKILESLNNSKDEKSIKRIEKSYKDIRQKFKRIPFKFLATFNVESYLKTNLDVMKTVEFGKLENALEHFILYGFDEVRKGSRKLRTSSGYFNEEKYLEKRKDVQTAITNGKIESAFIHYLNYGYLEEKNEKKNGLSIVNIEGLQIENKNKKNILICAHIAGKYLFGSERSFLDMVLAAFENGYNVYVTLPQKEEAYIEVLKKCVVKIFVFKYGWWRKEKAIDESVINNFESIIEYNNIDLCHVNTIMLRESLIASKNKNIRNIVHVRELISGDEALLKVIGETSENIANTIDNKADIILANSNTTAKLFEHSAKTHVIHNTVNIESFNFENIIGEKIKLGLISSNIPKKGIFDFVEVAKKCQDLVNVEFHLIGPDNEYITKLKQEQADGKISKNVVFSGYADTPQKAVKSLNIVMSLSNFTESFGRTVVEGMAAGRPVIAYNWGAVSELIENGKTGFLVEYKNIEEVVKKVKLLTSSKEMILHMGKEARKSAQAYSFENYKQKVSNLYDQILEKKIDKNIQNIKIGYFLWHFPVPSETFVLNELRQLKQQGYDVKVYCKQSPYKDFKPDFEIGWQRVTSPEDFAEWISRDSRNIIHSHFVYPTVTEMVWPACEIAKVNFSFIAHAQDIFRYANDEKNRIGELSASKYCQKVFVPSTFHHNYLQERGVSANKLVINPNGVDPALYESGWSDEFAQRNKRSICAIHRFTEKKGLEHLILAMEKLKDDIELHIYGYGDLEENYKQLIAEKKLINVFIHGGVKSRQEMLDIFQSHDLFACPSVRAKDGDMDGIPTVLMEAMASGIPVISTNISGIPDLITDGITGIISEATPDELCKNIKRYYALPNAKVFSIMKNAKEHIVTNYNTKNIVSNLLRVWNDKTVDMIIVSWNNLPELKEVLKRLLKYTSLPFRIVICDNNSEEDVKEYLRDIQNEREEITVIFNNYNAMVGPGTNLALQESKADYAIYVCGKEGFVFDYGWEQPLVKYMEEHPNVGIGGTLGYSPTYLYGKDYPTGVKEFPNFRNKEFATNNPDRIFKHVQGGFFIMRRKMYELIGGFNDFVPHNYTDVEYSYYAESCGWELGNIPNMLALYNKTRPGLFSRMDENMHAMHPPMMDELPLIDRIVHKQTHVCNICEWEGESFLTKDGLQYKCPKCKSTPDDRTLYRYLAESTLTYQRLIGLAIDLNTSVEQFWKEQFQGKILSNDALMSEIFKTGKIDISSNRVDLVYWKINLFEEENFQYVVKEVFRILKEDSVLLIQCDDIIKNKIVNNGLLENYFCQNEEINYKSYVFQYDWYGLLEYKKIKNKDKTNEI